MQQKHNKAHLRNTLGIPQTYHRNTNGTTLGVPWKYIEIQKECHRNIIDIASEYNINTLKCNMHTIEIHQEYNRQTIDIHLKYHRNTIGRHQEYIRNTSKIHQALGWKYDTHTIGTQQKHTRNTIDTSQEYNRNTLGLQQTYTKDTLDL